MIFEVRDGRPQPVLPRSSDGALRVVDGVQFLSIDMMTRAFGKTDDYWEREWRSFWSGVLVATAGASNDAGAAGAGGAGASSTLKLADEADEMIQRLCRFPHLEEHHWAYVKHECRRMRISPRFVWVKLQFNKESRQIEPVVIVTLAAMRMSALQLGYKWMESEPEFAGADGEWKSGPWVKDGINPHAARVYVTRRDTGEAVAGIAYFAQCAQMEKVGEQYQLVEMWADGRGAPQLAKCAKAAGLREAIPDLFGRVYTTDEMQVARADGTALDEAAGGGSGSAPAKTDLRGALNLVDEALKTDSGVIVGGTPIKLEGSGKLAATIPDDPRRAAELVDESTPGTLQSLERDLIVYADLSPAQAKDHIREFKSRLRGLFTTYFQGFAAVTLKAARDNPQVFGLTAGAV